MEISTTGMSRTRSDWQFAALGMSWKLTRPKLAFKANFDPYQPRIPAGSPGGGQRTDGGGRGIPVSDADRAFIGDRSSEADLSGAYRVAVIDGPQQYSVDLAEEEVQGGHTIARHVGQPGEALVARLRAVRPRYIPEGFGYEVRARSADGSFVDIYQANDFVNEVIRANAPMVALVSKGQSGMKEIAIEKRFGYRTGIEAYREIGIFEGFSVRKTYWVRVVIRYNANRKRSYTVVTAFPANGSIPGRMKIGDPE